MWALVLGIAISGLCAWGFLHESFLLFLFGLPGELAYVLISETGPEDGIAKILLEVLNLVVNMVFYYFLIRFIQSRIARRRLRNTN
jgi:hypothetical protein